MDPFVLYQIVQPIGFILLGGALAKLIELQWNRWHDAHERSKGVLPQSSVATNKLAEGRRWLLVGAPGQGKSFVARHLVRSYLNHGADVLIIDPEGASWPKGARAVGAPDDWDAIKVALETISSALVSRRAAFQAGERTFRPVLVVIDELPAVLRSVPQSLDTLIDLSQRGRKLGLHIVICLQSTAARLAELRGATALLNLFEKIETTKTATQIELKRADTPPITIRFSSEDDLVLPVTSRPTRPPSELHDIDRLLEQALGTPVPETEEKFISGSETRDFGLPEAREVDPVVVSVRPEIARGGAGSAIDEPIDRGETDPSETIALVGTLRIHWPTIAKLVQSGAITQTEALRGLGLKPGSSRAYVESRDALKAALDQLSEPQHNRSDEFTVSSAEPLKS